MPYTLSYNIQTSHTLNYMYDMGILRFGNLQAAYIHWHRSFLCFMTSLCNNLPIHVVHVCATIRTPRCNVHRQKELRTLYRKKELRTLYPDNKYPEQKSSLPYKMYEEVIHLWGKDIKCLTGCSTFSVASKSNLIRSWSWYCTDDEYTCNKSLNLWMVWL